MFSKQKLLAMLCGMTLLASLTACVTTMGSKEPTSRSDFCLVAKPIYWSANDTDETIIQAKEHNAVGKKLCGWGEEPKVKYDWGGDNPKRPT